MSKRRNRNRSAKRSKVSTAPTNTFQDRAYTYAQQTRRTLKSEKSDPTIYVGMDMDELRVSRKTDAAYRLMDNFMDALESIGWKDNAEAKNIWLHLTLGLITGTDVMDEEAFTNLAAAIWILDLLAECGRFEEACTLFPADPAVYEDQNFPVIQDVCHEERALRAMLWIIQHRNDDCKGLKAKDSAPFPRTYMDAYTANMTHHQDVPSRNRFTQILAMLPPEAIEDALTTYRQTYQDVLQRMLMSYQIIYNRRDQILDAQSSIVGTACTFLYDDYLSNQEAQKILTSIMTAAPSSAISNPGLPTSAEKYTRRVLNRSLYDHNNTLDDALLDLGGTLACITGNIHMHHIMSDEQRTNLFTLEVCDLWASFKVQNPYILCFAYLYLLDQGSDLPWIYGISSNILGFCANALPWAVYCCPADVDRYVPTDSVEHLNADSFELFDTYIPDRMEHEENHPHYYNLAQIIYLNTGHILPRRFYEYQETMTCMKRFGLRNTAYHMPLVNVVSLLNALPYRTRIPAPIIEEKPADTANHDALIQRIHELELEKKALRSEAYEASREARDLRAKNDALNSSVEKNRQELADLRELIFTRDMPVVEDATDSTISFPQQTSKNIVVFGGHPSWYNEISKKLPNVRFFRHSLKPDAQMIRNADEIWFQTNAISHMLYDTVTNLAARYPVKIRYFHFSSATKCAEELILAQSA